MFALAIGFAHAGGKADDNAVISFHIETEATDNPKMIFPVTTAAGETRYFRRMPEVSTRDIVAMGPFPAEDGSGYGVVFQLKGNAARRYQGITNANQGRLLAARVNGNVISAVMIDKEIDDGLIVIWSGITLDQITEFDKVVPRIGEDKKGKKGKKDKE